MVFDERSRDHRTHEIVENSMADRMRTLPGPCGASLRSEGPPKCQKYAFGTQNHLFREISRNYENPKVENFWSRIWNTSVLGFLHRFEVIRSTGGRGRAISGLERVWKSSREPECPSEVTRFGDCVFWSAGTPDAHRAMPPQGAVA